MWERGKFTYMRTSHPSNLKKLEPLISLWLIHLNRFGEDQCMVFGTNSSVKSTQIQQHPSCICSFFHVRMYETRTQKFPESTHHMRISHSLFCSYDTTSFLNDPPPMPNILGAGLDYNEEVHRSVKNFSPRQGYSSQHLVWWTR